MKGYGEMERGTLRWLVAAPGPDESIGSVLNRAASFYRCSTIDLWKELIDGQEYVGEIDAPSAPVLARMARTLGVPLRDLYTHRMENRSWLLAPSARLAYCPECWREDDLAGRPRGFRRAWARALRTICDCHNEPLQLADLAKQEQLDQYGKRRPLANDGGREVVAVIEKFAKTLEQSLFEGSKWPASWLGSPNLARKLLLRSALNLTPSAALPLIGSIMLSPSLNLVIHVPRTLIEPERRPPWQAFREIADPRVRRAALWTAVPHIVPDVTSSQAPDGVILNSFFEQESTWLACPKQHLHRRTRLILGGLALETLQ